LLGVMAPSAIVREGVEVPLDVPETPLAVVTPMLVTVPGPVAPVAPTAVGPVAPVLPAPVGPVAPVVPTPVGPVAPAAPPATRISHKSGRDAGLPCPDGMLDSTTYEEPL